MIGVIGDSYRAARPNQVANYHAHCLLFVHNDTVQRFQERLADGRIREAIENPYPKNFDPHRGFLNRSWVRMRSHLLGPEALPPDASTSEKGSGIPDTAGQGRMQRVNVPTVYEIDIQKADNPNAIMKYIHKHIHDRKKLEERQMIFKRTDPKASNRNYLGMTRQRIRPDRTKGAQLYACRI